MAVLREEGHCDAELASDDWIEYSARLFSGREPIERYQQVKATVGAFCADRTNRELLQASLDHRVLIGPTYTTAEIVANAQFAERGFWDVMEDPFLAPHAVRAPGLPVPDHVVRVNIDRAPRLDGHSHRFVQGGSRHATAGPPVPAASPTHSLLTTVTS